MALSFEELYQRINQAVCPEDLFAELPPGPEQASALRRVYRELMRGCHPDRHHLDPERRELAVEISANLNALYTQARRKIKAGLYGQRELKLGVDEGAGFLIQTQKRSYRIQGTLAQGDVATLYRGICADEGEAARVVIKLVDDPEDNDLIWRERRALSRLHQRPSRHGKHLPLLLDQFKSSEGQLGNIFRLIEGYDLLSIRARYPEGVQPEHALWILSRALSALGYAHSQGIIHGNLEPAHLMVRPRDHNLYLIDWCSAVIDPRRSGQGFCYLNEEYSPPEVAAREPPRPASDLYSLGKCMIYLLGGDPENNELPERLPRALRRFILFFLRQSPRQRAQDAWEMYNQLQDLRRELYGAPRFREFVM